MFRDARSPDATPDSNTQKGPIPIRFHMIPIAPDKRSQMMTWTAREVFEFLENCDLEGPAKKVFDNGVRGQDLAELTAEHLVADVGLTRFAARRVADARGEFLRG